MLIKGLNNYKVYYHPVNAYRVGYLEIKARSKNSAIGQAYRQLGPEYKITDCVRVY